MSTAFGQLIGGHEVAAASGQEESGYGRDSGMESVLESTQLKGAWIDLS